ncbi:MAG: peroxiredoxin [Steroidobacteraceae bacterium]|jgi:peroxiredoxin Q/BCP|nr:peroxiredoxin [Steroidobacteraceae bacterium]MCC7199089.1 peroxiredoxin [Gammaproteobacteria bacterium]
MTAVLKSFALACLATLLAFPALAGELAVGSPAPKFRLQDQNAKWHALDDYKGKWVVLYFYPKDNTPGCTTQACEFRDNIFAFRDVGAVVLGISIDDVASHRKFAEEHGLPFSILADSDKKVATQYGVLRKFLGMMELARRDTFIIDPQGRIAQHLPEVDPKGHSQVVLTELKKLGAKPVKGG